MKLTKTIVLFLLFTTAVYQGCVVRQNHRSAPRSKWTKGQANKWYAKQGWLVGANFIPSTAINQLEMWQEASFDTATINRELGWAESIGMNTMRVYLHDLLWEQDSTGLIKRMDTYLKIAEKRKIKTLFVLFDSCWDPFPKLGVQRKPTPFVHNPGWVQSPGADALKDSASYPRLERYVKGVISNFNKDKRILGWDVWNEPDNTNNSSYGKKELANKESYVLPLLKRAFNWSRSVNPTQPLTSGVWRGDWSSPVTFGKMNSLQLEESDIITFHNYDDGQEFEKQIKFLQAHGRPILCTEYMARGNNSTFQGSLPVGKRYNVGMINWGLVDGKTQTKYAWDSWDKKYNSEPVLWFHEVFQTDGKPYRKEEITLIKELTATKTNVKN